jgi:hypothetical protein
MFITKKHLSRRTFLKGTGVTMALPLLESMIPAHTALAQSAARPQIRLGFLYIPHGANMTDWTPATEGAGFELSRALKPLQNVYDNVVVVSNLAHLNAGPGPDDPGGQHGRAPSVFLNGARPRRTLGEEVRAATTADQLAAAAIGQDTRLPSLEMATEDMTGLIGACDAGFSCTYMNTISWRTPTTPLPLEINPRIVFNLLFGEGSNAAERQNRLQREKGILDALRGEADRLNRALGPNDRNRMAEYMDSVREIERRIQLAERQNGSAIEVPASPAGIPDDHQEHSKLMLDLMALAYEADITRVVSFMMAREVSYRTFPQIGVSDPFHPVSHHQDKPEQLEKYTKVNAYHVTLVARFLERLKATPDGDGNLLDHSLILYGSSLSNGNVHSVLPLPTFVAGGAKGRMKGGRHLKYPEKTPMANLLLTVLDKAGVRQDSIGDSTGLLTEV